jgi:hypothetical protein
MRTKSKAIEGQAMRFLGAMLLLALVAIAFSSYSDIAGDPLQARIIFCGAGLVPSAGHTNVAIAGESVTRGGPIGMTLYQGLWTFEFGFVS